MMGIRARDPPLRRIRLCKWTVPVQGQLALNVDGSMKNNSMAVGGILRDHAGSFVGAFVGAVGVGTSLHAEVWALHHGI